MAMSRPQTERVNGKITLTLLKTNKFGSWRGGGFTNGEDETTIQRLPHWRNASHRENKDHNLTKKRAHGGKRGGKRK